MDKDIRQTWYEMPVSMQISNIGSEVSRAINWKNKGNEKKNLKGPLKYEMPKGELVPTNIFKRMTQLREFTTPHFPAILTSGDKDHYNSMVIGWGSLGFSWHKPIFTVYVKPE